LLPADLLATTGVGFDHIGADCTALGAPALDSASAVAACLVRGQACRVRQMLTIESPRLRELLERGGFDPD
jgi:hypothetical protein